MDGSSLPSGAVGAGGDRQQGGYGSIRAQTDGTLPSPQDWRGVGQGVEHGSYDGWSANGETGRQGLQQGFGATPGRAAAGQQAGAATDVFTPNGHAPAWAYTQYPPSPATQMQMQAAGLAQHAFGVSPVGFGGYGDLARAPPMGQPVQQPYPSPFSNGQQMVLALQAAQEEARASRANSEDMRKQMQSMQGVMEKLLAESERSPSSAPGHSTLYTL